MNIVARLTSLNMDRSNLNELVEVLAEAKIVRTEFELHEIPTPEPLTEGIRTLNREIKSRSADSIERRLRELEAADVADLTASERREARKAERERLQAKLGTKEPTTA